MTAPFYIQITRHHFVILIQVLLLPFKYALAQEETNNNLIKEEWRKAGYQAKLSGDLNASLNNYQKILVLDGNDYDALLATAKIYFQMHNYEKALEQFKIIYKNDSADTEALNGMGECYLKADKNNEAILFFSKGVTISPKNTPLYLNLANAYLGDNNLKMARKNYEAAIKLDSTSAQAYAGLGKIFYWNNKPKTALTYYSKAININPSDKKIKEEYNDVLNEMKFSATIGIFNLKEIQESFNIKTFTQRYGITKRVNNYFNFSLTTYYDHAKRYTYIKDSLRRFDNTVATISLILNKHRLSLNLGGSSIDNKTTAYGINWLSNYAIGKIKIKNNFAAAYDYFFYWNKVDQDYIINSIKLSYKWLAIDANYKYGVVRRNYIWDFDTKDINPYHSYYTGIAYSSSSNPKITIGITRSYSNYTARSPLYFSPYQRRLTGIYLSPYYSFKRIYFYGSVAYREDNYNSQIWSGEIEIGYSINKTSVSAGWGDYNDPYYKNSHLNLILTQKF